VRCNKCARRFYRFVKPWAKVLVPSLAFVIVASIGIYVAKRVANAGEYQMTPRSAEPTEDGNADREDPNAPLRKLLEESQSPKESK
jgi:hypothetical protein